MTFDKVELKLNQKAYVIKGKNEDDSGQESNGSGKTSLLDIVAVGLLGESLTGRDLKNCVNWNGGESFFTITIILESDKGDITAINRKVYSNTRSAELLIFVNDAAISGVPTKTGILGGVDVKEGNKYILDKILGISKEDLLNYFLISGDAYQPFFSVNNTKKMEIISRFSKAQKVDKVIDRLGNELKVFNTDLLEYQIILSNFEGQLTSLNDLIDQKAIDLFEHDKQQALQTVLVSIEGLEQEQQSLVIRSIANNRHLDEKIESLQLTLNEFKDLEGELLKQKSKKEIELSKLNISLAEEIICPSCDYHFFFSDPQKSVDHIKDLVSTLSEEIQQLNTEHREVISENQKIQIQLTILEKSKREIESIEHSNNLIQHQKVDIQRRIEIQERQLLVIDARVFDDGGIKEKIEDIEQQKQQAILEASGIQKQVDKYIIWIDRFKQFKFYLANKPVEIICHYTNEFLSKLNSDLSISIEGFKVLKSGELKAELTPLVYRNQINPQSYSSFSGGEKVRLNLAADLALQRLINENSEQGLQFYGNDEALNSIDSLGLLNAAKAFNSLNQAICLISHSGSELNYENVITVEKKNGKSQIV